MNLEHLTPAPWVIATDGEFGFHFIPRPGGFPLLAPEDERDDCLAALEFAALARNAFDVMLRRGWTLYRDGGGWWVACESVDENGYYFGPIIKGSDGLLCWHTGLRPDPFTALVDADRWYREHVEGKDGGA